MENGELGSDSGSFGNFLFLLLFILNFNVSMRNKILRSPNISLYKFQFIFKTIINLLTIFSG